MNRKVAARYLSYCDSWDRAKVCSHLTWSVVRAGACLGFLLPHALVRKALDPGTD